MKNLRAWRVSDSSAALSFAEVQTFVLEIRCSKCLQAQSRMARSGGTLGLHLHYSADRPHPKKTFEPLRRREVQLFSQERRQITFARVLHCGRVPFKQKTWNISLSQLKVDKYILSHENESFWLLFEWSTIFSPRVVRNFFHFRPLESVKIMMWWHFEEKRMSTSANIIIANFFV